MTRRIKGQVLVETLIAGIIGVLVLVVVWHAYSTLTRQDAATLQLADRLQHYALARVTLEKDIDSRCLRAIPAVEDDGQVLVIPPHPERGGGEIRWAFDPKSGRLSRNGRNIGPGLARAATFAVTQDAVGAALTLAITWKPLRPEDKPQKCRIAIGWPWPKQDQPDGK